MSNLDGPLSELIIRQVQGIDPADSPPLTITIIPSGENQTLGESPASSGMDLVPSSEPDVIRYQLKQPIQLTQSSLYQLRLTPPGTGGPLALEGDTVVNEGAWDDGLPVRLDGYDPFGGIYPNTVNLFTLYQNRPDDLARIASLPEATNYEANLDIVFEDTPEKLEKVVNLLDAADYLVISSNRQYGTMTRMPERFPMTSTYYRHLMGCPEDKEILWCYRVAEPGMFLGDLGFELVKISQSDPAIGPLKFRTLFAEEAFTVYDHPKVLIFKKTAGYDSAKTREILSSTDFNAIIRKPPLRYENHPADLTLPVDRLSGQRLGGTWSELFQINTWINRYQWISVVVW